MYLHAPHGCALTTVGCVHSDQEYCREIAEFVDPTFRTFTLEGLCVAEAAEAARLVNLVGTATPALLAPIPRAHTTPPPST